MAVIVNFLTLGVFILLPIAIFLFWLALQYRFSSFIIYTNGVEITKPYSLLRHKFIPWNFINEIQIYNNKFGIGKFEYFKFYKALYFFLKNESKSIKISESWVEEIEHAYNLMKKHIKPYKKPEFCKNHPTNNAIRQCRSCGVYFCNECIEYKESFDSERRKGVVYSNCSLCTFKIGVKRVLMIYSIALIFPIIALIISFLNLFLNLEDYLFGNMFVIYGINGVNFQDYLFGHIYNIFDLDFENLLFRNIFGIFSINYALISVFYVFLIIPYAHAFHFANIKRSKILEQLGIKFDQKTLNVLTFFTILIILYYSIWYFFIYIGVFMVYTIYNFIIIPAFLLMEYPFRKRDLEIPLKIYSCLHCGEKFSPDSYFCTSCGGYLRETL